MSNSIGKNFVVTSFGESHGKCVGVVIDGCPAGLHVSEREIEHEMERRKPLPQAGGTTRVEEDKVEILSGLYRSLTTGAPICALVWNKNADSSHYDRMHSMFRPGQADYTAFIKYSGFNDYRGGGRFSGRITAGFVIAGIFAKKLLANSGINVVAHTVEIGGIEARSYNYKTILKNIKKNPLSCADQAASAKMMHAIDLARKDGDSLGGVIEGLAVNVPAGLGEPVFESLDSELAKSLFSIPAVKGVEFGAGFGVSCLKGSENNDAFIIDKGRIVTLTNNAGGILGGISNGMPVLVRVAIKPTASISKKQRTVDIEKMQETDIEIKGRHDACIVPRAVVVVESMMAVTLCDFAMRAGIIREAL